MPKTPWIGLLALVALFILPYVPDWLFEGPRTVKHRPRRHVCRDCGAPWTDGHACEAEPLARPGRALEGSLRRSPSPRPEQRPLTGQPRRLALTPRSRRR
jgi:hypothetical protein